MSFVMVSFGKIIRIFELGILFVVFGLQLFSVGLIGELILFTRAKDIGHYRIE